MISTSTTHRNKKGQAVIVIGMIVGLLFLLSVGLYAFELNRLEVARQQLQSACEAAALAGAATLAGSDEKDPYTAHSNAMATALHQFQQNSVAGTSLAGADQAINASTTPVPGDSNLYIEFLDPHNNNAVVQQGDPNGKIVKVYGAMGFQPAFGRFLGIGNLPLRAVASGGVPQLDVVLCFDVSASIDDQTPVTFVRRQWNSGTGKIDYIKTPTASGSPAGAIAQGPLYNIIGPPPTGSACDALPPQNLSSANQSDHSYRLVFDPVLRGSTNNSPPGNKSASVAIGTRDFTDLVVNIDGKNIFGGFTYKGYPFPDIATLVEASRGNLENSTVMTNSNADKGVPSTVKAMAGYRAAYEEIARQNIHPLYDAQVACQSFLDIMNTNTDAHFSLCCFTTNAGNSASDYITMPNVDGSYGAAGNGNFPNHLIPLQSSLNSTNYTQARADIANTTAISGTNIGDAVDTAVTQLSGSGTRTGAKKAIVVFTDGQPTSGGPLSSDVWTNAREAAWKAKQKGIPIYSIGLAQVPAIIPKETEILNDTNNSRTTGGISGIAGNGGKFWLVTNNANLRLTFENLARQLVQLVR
jgi:hypothetical protein